MFNELLKKEKKREKPHNISFGDPESLWGRGAIIYGHLGAFCTSDSST